MRWSWVGLGCIAALGLGARAAKPAEELPAPARAVVLPMMQNHRVDMERLLRAVVLLDRETAAKLAGELSGEARLARPTTRDATELNSLVPADFFEKQEAFELAARRFAEALPKVDDARLATEFAGLLRTCIECHSAYLEPPPRKL